MKSVTLRVPCFTPAQAHLRRCASIGTDVPFYRAPSQPGSGSRLR